MKKISVLALIVALSISLTGCFGGESKLYNAFNKMQDVTSIESHMEMKFNFETEGFSEEDQLMLGQIAAMVNNSKITMNQKARNNKEKTVSEAQVDMNMNFGGIGMDMNVWVDMDMSTDELKMKEIIKMPQILMSSMVPNDPQKQYLVLDMGQMMKEENNEINLNEWMKFSKEFQPKLIEFIKGIQKDFKSNLKIVEKKGSKVVNKEELDIYELKLNDATLKELVRDTVNYSFENEKIVEFVKEYMTAVVNIVPQAEKETVEVDMIEGLEELEKQLPEFKVKFNEFMDKYKDVKILGDKGIVIEYGINKEGYIVHQVASIDLRIDLGQIAKITGKEAEAKGIIKLGIDFSTNNFNINNKDMKIEIPAVNEKNSIDYMKMINM